MRRSGRDRRRGGQRRQGRRVRRGEAERGCVERRRASENRQNGIEHTRRCDGGVRRRRQGAREVARPNREPLLCGEGEEEATSIDVQR